MYKDLCKPAQFYVVLSLMSIILVLVQNLADSKKYCLGHYSCDLDFSNVFVFLAKLAYMLMWTIILQSLCKNGFKNLAWFIVLIPFVVMFMLLGFFIFAMK